MSERTDMSVVTEIGVFGDLDMKDPTAVCVESDETVDDMIAAAIDANKNINI